MDTSARKVKCFYTDPHIRWVLHNVIIYSEWREFLYRPTHKVGLPFVLLSEATCKVSIQTHA